MRIPPQLEKNHVVPTSWQDEALARDGVSREVPCSALKGERVPDSFHATPKSPRHTGFPRGEHRGSRLNLLNNLNSGREGDPDWKLSSSNVRPLDGRLRTDKRVFSETVPDSLPATPKSPPTRRVPPRGPPRVPAPLPLSPFSPPDRDRSPPGSQASSRGEAKDSALLLSRDAGLW